MTRKRKKPNLKLPSYVKAAIRCGPTPVIRDIDEMVARPITKGEEVVAFAHRFLHVPEGMHTGEPLRLDIFQIAFIIAVFDGGDIQNAYLSVGRRNGKTFVIGVILLAYICGPLAEKNTTLCSAAMSRDQAANVFNLMVKMRDMSPQIQKLTKVTPSSKMIVGLGKNVEYRAISSDARTGHGKAYRVVLLDEAGQIEGESNPFVEMLVSSQSNYLDPMFFIVSTQAASDASYFSIQLDFAERNQDKNTVSHLYTIPEAKEGEEEADLEDPKIQQMANPGVGVFRSAIELARQAERAKLLPSAANGILNLNFNKRVTLAALFMSPMVWKKNLESVDIVARMHEPIDIGLDLSQRLDLTAAVASWRNSDGMISLETHAFAPMRGLEARELRDKAPYKKWSLDGYLQLTPGDTVDYDWVCDYLAVKFKGCRIRSVQFDRWRIESLQEAAKRTGFFGMVEEWVEVGQGYVSISPRLDAFEVEAMNGHFLTGSHPLLNNAMAHAVAVEDAMKQRKLFKNKSTQRIDPAIAAVMAAFPNSDGRVPDVPFDVAALIA